MCTLHLAPCTPNFVCGGWCPQSDMVLCFDNAMTFNPPENMVHEEAAKLQVDVDKFFRKAEECLAG